MEKYSVTIAIHDGKETKHVPSEDQHHHLYHQQYDNATQIESGLTDYEDNNSNLNSIEEKEQAQFSPPLSNKGPTKANKRKLFYHRYRKYIQ